MKYAGRSKSGGKHIAVNVLLFLFLCGLAIQVPLIDASHGSGSFDYSQGYFSTMKMPVNPLGVITKISHVPKRADLIRRCSADLSAVAAVIKIKKPLRHDNNFFFTSSVIFCTGDSRHFIYTLLNIPPPPALS